ncbi:MAG: metallophosphoesterase [Agathobacter sp.]|uniref:metallophosphoesterase n=1 Tax=Agathobacter sp. TaxID=2021311 RepID=UPI00258D0EB1|nr:metallophosphoesterase [Agathobacter sp.]MCR5676597.1 metallophosphoesterase [Agathobacter sp.]
MKKILVLSDSHGEVDAMVQAVHLEKPDMVIHLGDCMRDATRLKQQCPEIVLEQVPGNCDLSMDVCTRVLLVSGMPIMICHGHEYGVKMGLLGLRLKAEELGVKAVLFGHTHRVFYEDLNGIIYLNPGSIGSPPYEISPSYGILTVDGQNEKIRYDVKYLEDVVC